MDQQGAGERRGSGAWPARALTVAAIGSAAGRRLMQAPRIRRRTTSQKQATPQALVGIWSPAHASQLSFGG